MRGLSQHAQQPVGQDAAKQQRPIPAGTGRAASKCVSEGGGAGRDMRGMLRSHKAIWAQNHFEANC